MKNNGFTLVELLAVLVILSLITLITVPIILGVLNSSKKNLNDTQVKAIENAAQNWGVRNVTVVDGGVSISCVEANELYDKGFLDNKVSGVVRITYEDNQLVYTYEKEGVCSDK